MKTKIVYILCSDDSDIYLEQTFLSVFSLRKYNPKAYVVLVVDQRTNEILEGHRSKILKYISDKTVVDVPEKFDKVHASRWIKTGLRKYVKGDYLFIDSDTVVTAELSNIEEFDGIIGAVPDSHVNIGKQPFGKKLRALSIKDGWTYDESLNYFNSGVMFVRDSEVTNSFYEKWHDKWNEGVEKGRHVSDQSYLASCNEEMGYLIKPLNGEWNCQIVRNGMPYLIEAKIIHYLGFSFHCQCPPWTFYDKNIYLQIKEKGCIPDNISQLVDDAKKVFPEINSVISNNEAVIARSRLFRFLLKNMWLVTGFENLTKLLKH